MFRNKGLHEKHLRNVHMLKAEERDQYRIALPEPRKPFRSSKCPHTDCSKRENMYNRKNLEMHLKSLEKDGHGLSADEAAKIIDDLLKRP